MKKIIIASFILCLTLATPQAFAGGGDDKGKEGEGAIKFSPYEYVQMDPVILPIIGHNGATQTVSFVVTLEMMSLKEADKATVLKPRLNDAFLSKMYGNMSHVSMRGGQTYINYEMMKKDLNKASVKVLGEESVHDVLIQVIQQQKI